jgi:hypothetical protein
MKRPCDPQNFSRQRDSTLDRFWRRSEPAAGMNRKQLSWGLLWVDDRGPRIVSDVAVLIRRRSVGCVDYSRLAAAGFLCNYSLRHRTTR